MNIILAQMNEGLLKNLPHFLILNLRPHTESPAIIGFCYKLRQWILILLLKR
jgi:hypothetical protein